MRPWGISVKKCTAGCPIADIIHSEPASQFFTQGEGFRCKGPRSARFKVHAFLCLRAAKDTELPNNAVSQTRSRKKNEAFSTEAMNAEQPGEIVICVFFWVICVFILWVICVFIFWDICVFFWVVVWHLLWFLADQWVICVFFWVICVFPLAVIWHLLGFLAVHWAICVFLLPRCPRTSPTLT